MTWLAFSKENSDCCAGNRLYVCRGDSRHRDAAADHAGWGQARPVREGRCEQILAILKRGQQNPSGTGYSV